MHRPRSPLLLLALLLLACGGLAAWALLPGRYPDLLYYQRGTFSTADPRQPYLVHEQWIDPRRGLLKSELRVGNEHAHLYIRSGLQYFFGTVGPTTGVPLDPSEARYYAWLFAVLGRGGYRGMGEALLARRLGPVTRVRFAGHAALHLVSAVPDLTGSPTEAWLDARGLEPLRLRSAPGGSEAPERILRTMRLPPGSLPAGFMDLPRPRRSAWDRALDWLGARLGRHD